MPTNSKKYMLTYYHANKDKFQCKKMMQCIACESTFKKKYQIRHEGTEKHRMNVRDLNPSTDDLKTEMDACQSEIAALVERVHHLRKVLQKSEMSEGPFFKPGIVVFPVP